jgi:hypothetical protein
MHRDQPTLARESAVQMSGSQSSWVGPMQLRLRPYALNQYARGPNSPEMRFIFERLEVS